MTDKELCGKANLKEALKLSDQTYIDKHPPIEQKVQYSPNYLKSSDFPFRLSTNRGKSLSENALSCWIMLLK